MTMLRPGSLTASDAELDLTIMICTRNRSHAIMNALGAVAEAVAIVQHKRVELIVVDNGSTDGTGDIVDRWATRQRFPVVRVSEPVAGLSRARNAGLGVARGSIVAMTDDDCILEPNYIDAVLRAFGQDNVPTIRGGRIELGDPADLAITIRTSLDPATLRRGQTPGGFVMGANLAFHRIVLEQIGPFDERFGAGAPFLSGEDTDFVFRAMEHGIPVKYDPTLVVRHFHGRRRREDALSLFQGYNFGDGALLAKYVRKSRWARLLVLKNLYWAIRDTLHQRRDPAGLIERKSLVKLRAQWQGFRKFRALRARTP